jgi:hypothetical protein
MYPADVQVDSYIKQMAELYGDADMPNFVAARDLVHTDNSDSRYSEYASWDRRCTFFSVEDVYHVLLLRLTTLQAESFAPLKFESSYSLTTAATPRVCYHTEATAIAYAAELGLLGQGLIGSDMISAVESWRLLLCLAIALRNGGLRFAEPFIVVRSIYHLFHGVSIGVFMASQSSKDDAIKDTSSFSQVVYVSPSSTAAPTQRDAFDGVTDAAVDANAACTLAVCVEHMPAILSNQHDVVFPSICICSAASATSPLSLRWLRSISTHANHAASAWSPCRGLSGCLWISSKFHFLRMSKGQPGHSMDATACWQRNINRLKTLRTPPI